MLFSGAFISTAAFIVWTSRLLRPIADDYGAGVLASKGFFYSVGYSWTNWSGAVIESVVGTLLVGLPLAWFPWPFASSLSFLIAAVLMVIIGVRMQTLHYRPSDNYWSLKFSLTLFAALFASWCSFWWLPVPSVPVESESYAIALAATNWQAVVTKYATSTAIVVLVWMVIQARLIEYRKPQAPMYLLLGVLNGLNHQVLSASSTAFIILWLTISFIRRKSFGNQTRVPMVLMALASMIGMVVSYLSPGSRNRMESLQTPSMGKDLLTRLVSDALPRGLSDWFFASVSWSSLLVFIVVGGVTYLFSPHCELAKARSMAFMGCGLSVFALIYSLASRAGQLFSYEAFWHLIGPRSVVWLSVVALATSLGMFLACRFDSSLVKGVIIASLAIGTYFVVNSVDLMNRQIIDRSEQWEVGPAPMYDTSDINDPSGPFLPAWVELSKLRDAPNRALP